MLHFGIDLDGVCFDWQYFVDWHNAKYGTTNTREDFLSKGAAARFGLPYDVLQHRVDLMYKTVGIRNLLPANGAVEGMRQLSAVGLTSVITSRPPWAHEDTHHWIKAYFNRSVTASVRFTRNHHALAQTSHLPTKDEVCIRDGVSYMLEDDLVHALPCAQAGIPTILFTSGEKDIEYLSLIYPVTNWKEAMNKLAELEKW